MKKKNILFILLAIALFISQLSYVKADSGWDSSYDSGSSSSSSWSSSDSGWSGSSWSSSSSSSSDDGIGIIPAIIIIIVIIIIASKSKNNTSSTTTSNNTSVPSSTVSDEEVQKYGINREQFDKMVYDKYVEIQNAWTDFDYDKLQKLLTDELYNSYVMQLDALQLKKQKNIMSDFKLISTKITDIKEENGLLNITTYLNVTMYDYVVEKDEKVLRGDDKHKIDISYLITFVKTSSQETRVTKCPNCGAEIDAVAGGKCEYCGTVIVVDAKDFVMSKKTCIGQRKL